MQIRRPLDKSQWQRLSPLLDELLDLDDHARAQRVSALRGHDAALADEVHALLARLPALNREAFLERPPLLRETALAGQTVGPYTIERPLGQGGMGSVWLARRTDGRYEGQVALKFVHAGTLGRGGAERFAREGSILARLSHPHIARLFDAGVAHDGLQPYLVLEYIAGVPIDRYCDEQGLDVAARVRLFLDVLAAVAHAHNRLTLHRDLKPSNILVTAAGEVKLLDFGIAKLVDEAGQPAAATEITQAAGRAYTAQYAAPEQIQDGEVSTATDVYALGVLLYVLLGGVHPTAGGTTTPVEQLRAVIETEPKRLSEAVHKRGDAAARRLARELRGDLDNIIGRALKKRPAERYANAAEFADDLRRHLQHEPVAARPDAPGYRLAKFVRRHRFGVAAGGVVASALAVGVGVALWQAHEAQRQRLQAEGLIEFMLGDLRKKLEPVGRLDVLDAVGERAVGYYAAQDARRLDAEALGRRSRALHLLGELHQKRGRLAEAQAAFARAAETTARLVEREPNDGQRVFDHAQSVYWVGYIAWVQGQAQPAEAAFRNYLGLARRLNVLDPNNLDWRLESAYAHVNLSIVHLESARPAQALESLASARDVLLRAAEARPAVHFDLANVHGSIATAREALADYDAAIDAQRAKLDALLKVPDSDTNRQVQRLRADAEHEQARLQLALGRPAVALPLATAALERMEALLALDAGNLHWLQIASFARHGLAEIQLELGNRRAAQALVDRVLADLPRVASGSTAASKRGQINLRGRVLTLMSRLALGQPGALLPAGPLEDYLASVNAFVDSGKALDPLQSRIVAAAELALGDLMSQDDRHDGAWRHWNAAADRLRSLREVADPAAQTLLARAEVRLGLLNEARSRLQRVQSSRYRHPDHAALVKELGHATGAWRHNTSQRR